MVSVIASRHQRSVLGLVGFSRVASGSLFGTAMAVHIGQEGSAFMVSLAYAVFSLGLLIFAPMWGSIADITGRRRLILIGTAFLSTLAIVPLTIQVTVPLEIICRGLFAIFTAGFQSTVLTIVSESGGDINRGQSIGFYNSARSGGAISGRLFVGYLLGLFVPSKVYFLVVILGLIASICTLFLVDPTPTPTAAITIDRFREEIKQRILPQGTRRELFNHHGLGWLYIGVMLRNMTEKGFVAVVPVFLVSDVGLSTVTMGAVLAVSPAVRVISMYFFGKLSDAVGRKSLIVGGLAGSGIQTLIAVTALVPTMMALRIGISAFVFFIHALTFSALTAGTIAFIGDVAPADRESELMGLRSTARGLGGVLGPLVVGVLATVFDYATAFVCISLLSFLAAILVSRTLVESHNIGSPLASAD